MLTGMRVLFTSVALSGHLFPLVPLAWSCRTFGHEVLVATSDNFLPEVTRSGLPVASCGPAIDFVELTTAAGIPEDLQQRRLANGHAFGRIAASALPGMLDLVRAWRPDVIVSERAEFAGPVAAAVCGVPQVELQWGVARLAEYRAGAAVQLAEGLERHGLAALPAPREVLNPWPPSLRLRHAASHHGICCVPYNGAARVPSWLWAPPRRPRICLTLGTVLPRLGADGVTDVVVPLLERLGRLDVEVVVAVDDAVAATWPPLPAVARQVGRMPLWQVLQTCDLAVHHGGQGTALTAFMAGVPQLVIPVFDDQVDNAEAVARSGAGACILPDELTVPDAVAACAALLGDRRHGAAARAVAAEIARQPSPATVVELLGAVARGVPATIRPRRRADVA
ncbi:DUF1205 domain-containing protein [Dactylosporangium maewongense]|uniref:DUF1205 domain-containing protein n=2 Tax=Micromonosporaceae TaxID=28056 RepID=A0ABN2BZ65_9ACTN